MKVQRSKESQARRYWRWKKEKRSLNVMPGIAQHKFMSKWRQLSR
jgi:hypothetical protein